MADPCLHVRLTSEVCDQTLGVACLDCKALLAWCWQDNHIPESLWNRAAAGDEELVPCEMDRDDHCALCGEAMADPSGDTQGDVEPE